MSSDLSFSAIIFVSLFFFSSFSLLCFFLFPFLPMFLLCDPFHFLSKHCILSSSLFESVGIGLISQLPFPRNGHIIAACPLSSSVSVSFSSLLCLFFFFFFFCSLPQVRLVSHSIRIQCVRSRCVRQFPLQPHDGFSIRLRSALHSSCDLCSSNVIWCWWGLCSYFFLLCLSSNQHRFRMPVLYDC